METTFTAPALMPALPEIFLLTMACVILIADLFFSEEQRVYTYILSLLTLAGLAGITFWQLGQPDVTTFSDMYVADGMAHVLKLFSYAAVAAAFVYSRDYLKARDIYKGEFYVLGLFSLMGMMIIISGHHFLTLYLGLELMSLCLYGMVAMRRDDGIASEAAMKYFVLSSIASGMLLYGISILYGVSGGALGITEFSQWLATAELSTGLGLGLVFIVVAVAFKFGAVPFHMWLPDVYDGAPTAVTLFLGTAPKFAAFAMVMRLLADALGAAVDWWQPMLAALAVLSMGIGAVVAIAQVSLKRMLAYSTIMNVGFILMGVLAGTEQGYQAAMFYTIVYVIMAAAGFGMILLLARNGFEGDKIDDFAGLARRNPWFAAVMMFVMFGMAGVPPFAGFYAKFEAIRAALDVGLLWLALSAVVFSVIAAFYYLRLVKVMYFDEPAAESQVLDAPMDARAVMTVNGLAILLLGIFPGGLMAICLRAIGG
ncbi:MAG: NADH-quinone oxidoreductase subunit NuoN [Gammaproteobacteria bacterium]|nr:NADH-quinone oxidoreductase subunit NuoN [Gammaproteobacteria bacterium]